MTLIPMEYDINDRGITITKRLKNKKIKIEDGLTEL